MIAMSDVIALDPAGEEHRIGTMHHDARGYVAWDRNGQWLGKTDRSRFSTQSAAFKALEAAFAAEKGIFVRVTRFAAPTGSLS
jgi:hypothetical protein